MVVRGEIFAADETRLKALEERLRTDYPIRISGDLFFFEFLINRRRSVISQYTSATIRTVSSSRALHYFKTIKPLIV